LGSTKGRTTLIPRPEVYGPHTREIKLTEAGISEGPTQRRTTLISGPRICGHPAQIRNKLISAYRAHGASSAWTQTMLSATTATNSINMTQDSLITCPDFPPQTFRPSSSVNVALTVPLIHSIVIF